MAEQAKQDQQKKQDQSQGDQADAAVKEVEPDPKPRTIKVQKQEFTIPDSQPSEILFSARSVSRATRTGDEGAAVEAMMNMAIAYIGEENLRDLLADLDLEKGMSVVEDVLSAASTSYGSNTGE